METAKGNNKNKDATNYFFQEITSQKKEVGFCPTSYIIIYISDRKSK